MVFLSCFTQTNLSGTPSSRFHGTDIPHGTNEPEWDDDLCFAWMEHRRWNAFMRAQGFSLPDEQQSDPWNALSNYDALDLASIQACHLNCELNHTEETQNIRNAEEYKQYDYFSKDKKAQRPLSDLGSSNSSAS